MTDINRLGKDFANLFKDPDEFVGTSSGMPNADGTVNVSRQDGGGTVNAILANNGRSPVTLCQRINGQWYAWRQGEAQVTNERTVLERRSRPDSKRIVDEIGILYFKKDYTQSNNFVVCASDYQWGAHVSFLNRGDPIAISSAPPFPGSNTSEVPDTDVAKEGVYPNIQDVFPSATLGLPTLHTPQNPDPDTLDAIIISPGVMIEIWEQPNFQGKKLFEAMGPFVLTTVNETYPLNSPVNQPWQSIYSLKKRRAIDEQMYDWRTGSVKIYKPKFFWKFASKPNVEIPIDLGEYYFGYASFADQKHSWLSTSQCCYITTLENSKALINLHLTQIQGSLPATRTIIVKRSSITEDETFLSPSVITTKNQDWQKDWAYTYNSNVVVTNKNAQPNIADAPCFQKYKEKNANFNLTNNKMYLVDLDQIIETTTLRSLINLQQQKAIVQTGIATTIGESCDFTSTNKEIQFPKLGNENDEIEVLAVSVLLK